jgi:hypothetical protein
MHGFGLIFWLVIIIGSVGFVWFFGLLPKARNRMDRSTARELLEERCARGEIDRDEYLQKKTRSRRMTRRKLRAECRPSPRMICARNETSKFKAAKVVSSITGADQFQAWAACDKFLSGGVLFGSEEAS